MKLKIPFLLCFSSLFIISSCSGVKKDDTNNFRDDSPLVFIHGIKGSSLIEKNSGKTFWLTPWQGLGFDTQNLKLPLSWSSSEIPEQQKDNIVADKILDSLTLIPNIIDVKIYNGILNKGKEKYGNNFYPFAYDWRRSNLENVEAYLVFLKKLEEKYHKPIKVVSHSMGGLITMVAMQREPKLFDKVFFVGVPFAGGVGFLEDIHSGISVGSNSKILSPEVLSSMPSIYTLFPLKSKGHLSDGKNKIDVDFFNAKDWENLKIGPFANTFSQNDVFKSHFSNSLKVAKTFREELNNGKLVKNNKLIEKQPNIYVILGKSLPTLKQVIRKSNLEWDFSLAEKEVGDGSVGATNAYPPEGLKYEEFESKAQHAQQLNDPSVLDWIFSKI